MTLAVQGNNNSREALWMENYQTFAKTLGPDQFAILKKCQPKTGMRTHMIEIFEEMRKPLMALSPDTLVDRYKMAHKEFKTYVAYRLECLKNPEKVTSLDPWFKLSFSPGKQNFRDISFRIQDLLKDSELVAEFGIDEGCAVIDADLIKLIDELPGYFAKLHKKKTKSEKAIVEKFSKLEAFIHTKNFKQANVIVKEIKADLKALVRAFEA